MHACMQQQQQQQASMQLFNCPTLQCLGNCPSNGSCTGAYIDASIQKTAVVCVSDDAEHANDGARPLLHLEGIHGALLVTGDK